jgi:hypothetical protein
LPKPHHLADAVALARALFWDLEIIAAQIMDRGKRLFFTPPVHAFPVLQTG